MLDDQKENQIRDSSKSRITKFSNQNEMEKYDNKPSAGIRQLESVKTTTFFFRLQSKQDSFQTV